MEGVGGGWLNTGSGVVRLCGIIDLWLQARSGPSRVLRGVWGAAPAAGGPFARSAKFFWNLVTLLYRFIVKIYCKDVR